MKSKDGKKCRKLIILKQSNGNTEEKKQDNDWTKRHETARSYFYITTLTWDTVL